MNRPEDFDSCFELLTEHKPFPWQQALFAELVQKRFPNACDLPTGLGKTSIIGIWLLALAHHARTQAATDFPRRLVYVVNRRTVVDQATREVEQMRDALAQKPELEAVAAALRSLAAHASDAPLAISTLRGQFADNAEWRNDPARPAVIVGTVDMIGSRLLFTGYGCGFKSRPLHAGFLGQDTLLVHDEAHLEPAFQQLLTTIESEQRRGREFGQFRVVELTATSRSGGEPFRLTAADREHDVVRKRLGAKKGIAFWSVDEENKIADQVAKRALEYKDSGQAILIFLRKLDDVEKVSKELQKKDLAFQPLTGTLRGLERDELATSNALFARFMPKPKVTPKTGTVYLVCTSAGEVGIDISADHMVCDLTPFDSMAQRFGRVNRFGEGDAAIDVVHRAVIEGVKAADEDQAEAEPGSPNFAASNTGSKKKAKPQSPFDQACERTLSLLHELSKRDDQRHDASPAALGHLPAAVRRAAFTPPPIILPASDILFDAWALTSIRQKLPGRPPVTDWLHGVAEWEPPETHVTWRDEVGIIVDPLLEDYEPEDLEDLLEDYPLKPHELLRNRSDRVLTELTALANHHASSPVWLVASDGSVSVTTLRELTELEPVELSGQTVLLPPEAGGLKDGMLDGGAAMENAGRYNVSDRWMDAAGEPSRLRVWDNDERPEGMRLVRTVDTRPHTDGDETDEEGSASRRRYWNWYVRPRSADDEGSRAAAEPQKLAPHLQSAAGFATAIVGKLGLSSVEASAVTLAAGWHDRGKDRAIWQRSINNPYYPQLVLAKSGGRMQPKELNKYRHEFGSLLDVSNLADFGGLATDVKDLVLHLIATHHGRARPHFPADEVFDPKHTDEDARAIAREVPRRFARLQRKYGRWGLAYLESLVRAADILASQTRDVREQEPIVLDNTVAKGEA